jgi:aminoglycoside N3'-acetyltransferase
MATQKVVIKEDIVRDLRALGLKEGDIVGVHSSLSSFGHVEGGADAVIDALLEVVGKEGTIVMPTHSRNLERVELSPEEEAAGVLWLYRILPYDPERTPCTTGVIPETFRKRPGAVRSLHPVFSIAAIGPKAEEIVRAGDKDSLGGWKIICDLDGYVLLLGVDLGVCTAMHLAERIVELPERILAKITPPGWFVEKYPKDEWEWDIGPYPNFAKLEPICKERGIMRITVIGEATVKLLKLRELIDLYAQELRKNPELFYGEPREHEQVRNGPVL